MEDKEIKAVKRRMNRAIKAASNILDMADYNVRILDGNPFHIEAIRKKEIRNIRIILDKPSKKDIALIEDFELPDACSKEVWCKQGNLKKFNILKIL